MKAVVYLCIQAELADFAWRLRRLALDEFIAAAERADRIGPILQPELYRLAGARLADILVMARAAKEFCRLCEKIPDDWLLQLARSIDALAPAEKPTAP
jgi:hypothetical protein